MSLALLALTSPGLGGNVARAAVLDDWIKTETPKATTALLANISRADTARGAIVASPSKDAPNYYYHWIRDAALTMDTLVTLYRNAPNDTTRAYYYGFLTDYIAFSRNNQITPNRSGGLGEPKFNVDGSAFTQDWGRPQNDGPALRAITLTHLAQTVMVGSNSGLVADKLYSTKAPSDRLISADLGFIVQNWQQTSFDPWEECRGHHFYVRMVQRRALLEGAALAETLGDLNGAQSYRATAKLLETELNRHWDAKLGYIVTTLDRDGGIDYKVSGLDSSVILAILHGFTGDNFFSPTDDKVLATAEKMRSQFAQLYAINSDMSMGTGIGRYPEDRYNGYTTTSLGNPWIVSTHAFAELYYRMADALQKQGQVQFTPLNLLFFAHLAGAQAFTPQVGISISSSDPRFANLVDQVRQTGDSFMLRTRYHSFADGSMSEEFNRDTGFMQGAADLTWNYASFLTAAWLRPTL